MPKNFSACSASSAFNVAFFHKVQADRPVTEACATVRLKPDTTTCRRTTTRSCIMIARWPIRIPR